MRRALAGAAAIAAVAAVPAHAAGVKLEQISGALASPVYVTSEPADADRLYVVERGGRIRLLKAGRLERAPFLDLRPKVRAGGEQGLLNVVFDPDYADNGRLYVYYAARGAGNITIARYQRDPADPDRADPASGRTILTIGHGAHPNHYGSAMHFGPDGALYVSTGDGGGVGNPLHTAQRRSSPLGKILRLADPAASGRYSVWAYGLRNAWRFSFDMKTGAVAIGDVGQDKYEEVDFVKRSRLHGANFGWNVFEGTHHYGKGRGSASGHVKPVIQHSHSAGWCSIIGGHVVRDPELPALQGRYVYGDLCQGRIWSAKLGSGGATGDRPTSLKVSQPTSFGEDAKGRVYVVTLFGDLFRLAPE